MTFYSREERMNPSNAARDKGMSFRSFKIIIFLVLLFIVAAIVAVTVYVFVVREKGNFTKNKNAFQ